MKYRLKAASIALAISLVPGILLAGTSGGSMVVTGFDPGKELVSGITQSWQIENVRHTAATEHAYVSEPQSLPPGPCKSIAVAWNVFVFQNRSREWFTKLLDTAAKNACTVDYVRTDIPSQDGSFELVSVKPGK